jgi:ketosteroid isomerase-like protein
VTTAATPRTPAQTVEEFVRTYNEHDMVANHALIDPAFIRYGQTTGWQPMGYESYRGIFQPFLAAFPDFHWELSNLVAGGDWVAIEVIETGTFKASYEYKPGVIIEPTGKSYACHYAIFFKVHDGLITEYRFYEDASFITQLGIDAASIRLNT